MAREARKLTGCVHCQATMSFCRREPRYTGDSYSQLVHPEAVNSVFPYSSQAPSLTPRVEAFHGENAQVIASKLNNVLEEIMKQRKKSALLKKDIDELKGEVKSIKARISSGITQSQSGSPLI